MPGPPAPMEPPGIELEPTEIVADLPTPHLVPPQAEGVVDELLASRVLRDPQFRDAVEGWTNYWTRTAAVWFPDFVRRMGRFEAVVDASLAEQGMPASLRYLPLIESGYNPSARSRATAVGLWQFMAGTARSLGMDVTPFVDERRNPYKSTDAAVRFLSSLRDEFGSWFLALAAYNSGPTRTRRILRRHAPLAPGTDSLFWALRGYFPRETQEFVPKLISAILVTTDPAGYGLDLERDGPLTFDQVTVPDATTLDVVARAAGVSLAEIESLNPELVRGVTPPRRPFVLRVPAGREEAFETRYALIPPEERVSFVEHTVTSGETLSHIARRYRISVADLRAANPAVRPRFLRIGAQLTVPIAPNLRVSG
jgi:membrane-bound lytic murein transglycosylase D